MNAVRKAWGRIRHALRRPMVIEGISINDDFANADSDVLPLVRIRKPGLVGVQEGFRVDYRKRLGHRWGVRHRMLDLATAGVAVIWDRVRFKAIGRHSDDPADLGHGWQQLIDITDTRARGVVWQDLRRRLSTTRLRVASAHRLPIRDSAHWAAQDRALAHWLVECPLPVVLFMDGNEHGGPAGLLRLLPNGWRWVGVGIDGAITNLPTGVPRALARGTSDHHATSIPIPIA